MKAVLVERHKSREKWMATYELMTDRRFVKAGAHAFITVVELLAQLYRLLHANLLVYDDKSYG